MFISERYLKVTEEFIFMVVYIISTMIFISDIHHLVIGSYLVVLASTSLPVSNFHIQFYEAVLYKTASLSLLVYLISKSQDF